MEVFLTILAMVFVAMPIFFGGNFSSTLQKKKLPPRNLGLPFIGESIGFLKAYKANEAAWIEEKIANQLAREFEDKDSVHAVPIMKELALHLTCALLFGLADEEWDEDAMFQDFTGAPRGLWTVPINFPRTTHLGPGLK
ncbi:hypothetical protein AMTR_s00153p00067430 [Amborella trichopoda]|uniref:Cytochrome P450 n=1 Tax=Amborella trichopoda TaxID=13333 RepID=W1PP88_AMBTC|nr:hypothetical protein AMTR_s00153p00067430 [Amborella trichopoda]